MADHSAIEWTDATWNPVTGCTKVSEGCRHCYAERLTERFHGLGSFGFIRLHPERLDHPLRWRRPRHIFVNSMSDLFHESIPQDFIRKVFEIMCYADWHVFQILTKRAERLKQLSSLLPWQKNIWPGVSVEDARFTWRIRCLQQVPASVRFISVEPLLGPIPHLPLEGIHWVIVGGESGPGHRPVDSSWVREIRDQCVDFGIPFFFKQWGGRTPKSGGRVLDGRLWNEMPRQVQASPLPLVEVG